MTKGYRTWSINHSPGAWRWRERAANNRITAASTEGYRNRAECAQNAIDHGGPVELMNNDVWHKKVTP
jgi:hypothetical protein